MADGYSPAPGLLATRSRAGYLRYAYPSQANNEQDDARTELTVTGGPKFESGLAPPASLHLAEGRPCRLFGPCRWYCGPGPPPR